MSETNLTRDWQRPNFTPGGGEALLFYAVFGTFQQPLTLSRAQYHFAGKPPELQVSAFLRSEDAEFMDSCTEDYLGKLLREAGGGLFEAVRSSQECIRVSGYFEDPSDLNYLRDTVGFLTAILDQGGVAVYDPLRLAWWHPNDWKEQIFAPDEVIPKNHITLLLSAEDESEQSWWIHSRGMRKFGRPDVSIHAVTIDVLEPVAALCWELMEMQASGHLLGDGQRIRTALLPVATCHHAGDLDDPDFNNVHIELTLDQ